MQKASVRRLCVAEYRCCQYPALTPRTSIDDRLPKLRCLDVSSRRRGRVFTQPFIEKKKNARSLAAVNRRTTFTEPRQNEWTTDAAAELTEEALDSSERPRPKSFGYLLKALSFGLSYLRKALP